MPLSLLIPQQLKFSPLLTMSHQVIATVTIHVVFVRATDSAGHTSDQTLTVSIADADEVSPTITGPSGSAGALQLQNLDENTTSVYTFSANETVTWSLNELMPPFFY